MWILLKYLLLLLTMDWLSLLNIRTLGELVSLWHNVVYIIPKLHFICLVTLLFFFPGRPILLGVAATSKGAIYERDIRPGFTSTSRYEFCARPHRRPLPSFSGVFLSVILLFVNLN